MLNILKIAYLKRNFIQNDYNKETIERFFKSTTSFTYCEVEIQLRPSDDLSIWIDVSECIQNNNVRNVKATYFKIYTCDK